MSTGNRDLSERSDSIVQEFKSPDYDPSLIEYNLSLTYEERLINHQRALDTLNELKKAGEKIYGKPITSSQTSS